MLCLVWCLVESFQGAHTPPARTHQHHRWLDTREVFFFRIKTTLFWSFILIYFVLTFPFLPPFENCPENLIPYIYILYQITHKPFKRHLNVILELVTVSCTNDITVRTVKSLFWLHRLTRYCRNAPFYVYMSFCALSCSSTNCSQRAFRRQ